MASVSAGKLSKIERARYARPSRMWT
ncbi:hypothetical protein ACFWBI_08405 [Streptomyces sp. NPDC059982]